MACVLCGNYDVLEYMVQQPECPVEAFVRDQLPRYNNYIELPRKTLLLETAVRRQRWTAARATWLAACGNPGRALGRPASFPNRG